MNEVPNYVVHLVWLCIGLGVGSFGGLVAAALISRAVAAADDSQVSTRKLEEPGAVRLRLHG